MAQEATYTTAEAAALLGISERTAQRWIRGGRLRPARRFGQSALVFTAAELRRVAALPKPRRGRPRKAEPEGLFPRPNQEAS